MVSLPIEAFGDEPFQDEKVEDAQQHN